MFLTAQRGDKERCEQFTGIMQKKTWTNPPKRHGNSIRPEREIVTGDGGTTTERGRAREAGRERGREREAEEEREVERGTRGRERGREREPEEEREVEIGSQRKREM